MTARLDGLLATQRKCGSRYLLSLVAQHPDAFVFRDSDARWDWAGHTLSLAGAVPGGKVLLARRNAKWTTKRPAHALCHAHNGEMRIVALVRDPVARAVSNFVQSATEFSDGRRHEPCVAEQATRQRFGRTLFDINRDLDLKWADIEALHFSFGTEYALLGLYDRVYRPFFEVFGGEQVLVIPLELFRQSPEHHLRRVFAHLGLSAEFAVSGLERPRGERRGPQSIVGQLVTGKRRVFAPLNERSRQRLANFYRPDAEAFSELTGEDLCRLWGLDR